MTFLSGMLTAVLKINPTLVFLVIIFLLFYLRVKFFNSGIKFLKEGSLKEHGKYYDINTIIHFHTTYSDGSGSIRDIIRCSENLNIDVLISSDHNTMKPKEDGMEGYYGKILYFAAEEVNTEYGHLLALGIDREIPRGDYERVLRDVKGQDGLPVICHPHNWWTPWKNFSVKGYGGIEIINLDSQWRGMNPFYILIVFLTYKINPYYSMHFLHHKPKKTLEFWDSVQEHGGMITGIASIDAHSNIKVSKKIRIKIPKYSELFSVARTHVLLDNKLSGTVEGVGQDKANIIKAVKDGKCYMAFDMFGAPEGFYFEAFSDGKYYISGDSLTLDPSSLDNSPDNVIIYSGIRINPKKNRFTVKLFLNGNLFKKSRNKDLEYKFSSRELKDLSGNFTSLFLRVEVDVNLGLKNITYLYSNNIEIFFNLPG